MDTYGRIALGQLRPVPSDDIPQAFWWYNCLLIGMIPSNLDGAPTNVIAEMMASERADWLAGGCSCEFDKLLENFTVWTTVVPGAAAQAGMDATCVGPIKMRKSELLWWLSLFCPSVEIAARAKDGVTLLFFPRLETCRREFERFMRESLEWAAVPDADFPT